MQQPAQPIRNHAEKTTQLLTDFFEQKVAFSCGQKLWLLAVLAVTKLGIFRK
jgi:hypothetical protein